MNLIWCFLYCPSSFSCNDWMTLLYIFQLIFLPFTFGHVSSWHLANWQWTMWHLSWVWWWLIFNAHCTQSVFPAPLCAVSSSDQQGSVETDKVLSASPMMQVEAFFMALTNSNTDGRVVVHTQGTFFFHAQNVKDFKKMNFVKSKFFSSFYVQVLCQTVASSSCCWIRPSTSPRC